MSLRVTILGCGNSSGVPGIGNYWGACDPAEPKNLRMRASIAVQSETTSLVIDTGPDFRHQMNRAAIETLDAVLYTHGHADHVAGIDDLRAFHFRSKTLVPIHANGETLEMLKARVPYLFQGGDHAIYPPILEPHEIAARDFGRALKIGDISFLSFEQDHGSCHSVGYRFGDFAYCVDMHRLDERALEILRGVKIWIVDGAAYKDESNPVHAHLTRLYAYQEQIQAQKVYVTSLSLAMDYRKLMEELPAGFFPAYDGLSFDGLSSA